MDGRTEFDQEDLLSADRGDTFGGFNLGNILGSAASAAASSGALSGAGGALTGALGSAVAATGIDPSVISAAASAATTPLAKTGLAAGLTAAAGAVDKTAPHTDPNVIATKMALPKGAHTAFDAGAALVAGHAKTGGVPLPGSPAAQAAHLINHGMPSRVAWVHIGIGAAAAAGIAAVAGLAGPVALGAGLLGAGATYLIDSAR